MNKKVLIVVALFVIVFLSALCFYYSFQIKNMNPKNQSTLTDEQAISLAIQYAKDKQNTIIDRSAYENIYVSKHAVTWDVVFVMSATKSVAYTIDPQKQAVTSYHVGD